MLLQALGPPSRAAGDTEQLQKSSREMQHYGGTNQHALTQNPPEETKHTLATRDRSTLMQRQTLRGDPGHLICLVDWTPSEQQIRRFDGIDVWSNMSGSVRT